MTPENTSNIEQDGSVVGYINLGAGLEVVRAFLDFVARSDCGPAFVNSPEYVAARCVLDRLHNAQKPDGGCELANQDIGEAA